MKKMEQFCILLQVNNRSYKNNAKKNRTSDEHNKYSNSNLEMQIGRNYKIADRNDLRYSAGERIRFPEARVDARE